jgi:hypothetical protein
LAWAKLLSKLGGPPYSLADANSLKRPSDGEKKIAGFDWFYAFMKGNTNVRLSKPEELSRCAGA